MQLSLPSVKLPSRTGLLVMAGAGAAGVLGLLSTPVAVIIGAVPMIGANIPDEGASRRASTTSRRTSATTSSPAPRSAATRSGAKRSTATRSTTKRVSTRPRAGAKRAVGRPRGRRTSASA